MDKLEKNKAHSKPGLGTFVEFLDEHAVSIYSTIAAALFALNGYIFSLHHVLGIIDIFLAILFFMLSLFATTSAKRSSRQLSGKIKSLNHKLHKQKKSLTNYLEYLVESLFNGTLGFQPSERISVFEITKGGFELVARFSTNPELCNGVRRNFPLDYGIIGAAFKADKGEAFDLKLPDPEADFAAYEAEQQEKWEIPKTHLKKMRMKPRGYSAFVVNNGLNSQVSGVILFESTHPGKLGKEMTRKAAKCSEVIEIGNLLGFADVGE